MLPDGYTLEYNADTGEAKIFSAVTGKYLKQHLNQNGYYKIVITVDKRCYNYLIHRLIALYHIPNEEGLETVDHIDGCITNNRLSNLHWVSSIQNSQNQRKAKGYIWIASRSKWRAKIVVNKKVIYLGEFLLEEDARKAYEIARYQRNTESGATIDGYEVSV